MIWFIKNSFSRFVKKHHKVDGEIKKFRESDKYGIFAHDF